MIDRFSLDSEGSVIGSVLMYGPESYDACNAIIQAEDFIDPSHRQVWCAAEKLILQGKYVDLVSIISELPGTDIDWAQINELTSAPPTPRRVEQYAKTVLRQSQERKVRDVAFQVSSLVDDGDLSISQRISQSVQKLEQVIDERSSGEPVPVSNYGLAFIDRMQARSEGREKAGRPSGFWGLDRLMPAGLADGKLVVLAARPSIGKSSLAQQIAQFHASQGFPSAFLGMEMENDELTDRLVANRAKVELDHIQTGDINDGESERVTKALEWLKDAPFYISDTPGLTLANIASTARGLVRKRKIKTLVIDYLQLMRGSDDRKDRRVQLEEITRGLKRLAKQLKITIILLSQLNREVEKRSNPRPIMSDLKECGAIEEDADVIMFLWDFKAGDGDAPWVKGLSLAKNRGGMKGEIALEFYGQYQLWETSGASLSPPKAEESKPTQQRGMR